MTVLKLNGADGEAVVTFLIEVTGIAVRPQGSGSRIFSPSGATFDVIETPDEIYAMIYPPTDSEPTA